MIVTLHTLLLAWVIFLVFFQICKWSEALAKPVA